MEFKVENICGFLIRSKLMSAEQMQTMRQRWNAEAKESATQATAFLKWLVAKSYVTEYQAGMLSRGHVDEFFLGDYKILERIGRGRMAGVYRAAHASGQVVAIKVLPPSKAKDPQTLARFQREARLAAKLKHPNVVRAFQVGEARGINFMVMECLDGEPLDEVLARRKRLPPAEGVRIVHQALLGLQHLHEQGMVHRDLKPANLMLVPAPARTSNETTLKSNVKILDIGLAREFFDENAPSGADQAELTGEGVLLGTPDYLAPEQAKDPRTIDIRADIYSLGCTLYHLLAGQPPFPDKSIMNLIIRHATETPKPLTEFNPSIPEGLQQIVSWMMAKSPDQRYPTPARAAQALDAFLLVTADSTKPAEESAQMKEYLTWLEAADPGEQTPKAKAGSKPEMPALPPAAPKTSAAIPALAPKTAAAMPALGKPAAAKPERKAKSSKTPPPPSAAPVAPPAPAALAEDPGIAEQYDVELVEIPPTPTAKPERRLGKRDIIMLAVGGVVTMIFVLCCGVASFLASRFRGE